MQINADGIASTDILLHRLHGTIHDLNDDLAKGPAARILGTLDLTLLTTPHQAECIEEDMAADTDVWVLVYATKR